MPSPRCMLFSLVTILALITAMTWSIPAGAGQTGRGFNVTVNLQANPGNPPVTSQQPNSAFCRIGNDPNAFGATYTVVCATGAVVDIEPGHAGQPFSPMHGGAYRYLFQANRGSNQLGTIDSYLGAGTSTSWRIINLTDRDYLEMLINW